MLFEVWTNKPRLRIPSAWLRTGPAPLQGSFRWIAYPVLAGDDRFGTDSAAASPAARGSFSIP